MNLIVKATTVFITGELLGGTIGGVWRVRKGTCNWRFYGEREEVQLEILGNPERMMQQYVLESVNDRPVQSNTISTSLGGIQPYVIINDRRLLVHISTTVYS